MISGHAVVSLATRSPLPLSCAPSRAFAYSHLWGGHSCDPNVTAGRRRGGRGAAFDTGHPAAIAGLGCKVLSEWLQSTSRKSQEAQIIFSILLK